MKDAITVTAAAHPFKVAHHVVEVIEGPSLADMLHEQQPDPVLARHANIFIGGHRIERQYWRCVYPKAGVHVEIKVLPSGGGGGGGTGGKNVLRTVLTLAVVAASFAVPALVPGTSIIAAGTLGGQVFTAGVGRVGPLLVRPL